MRPTLHPQALDATVVPHRLVPATKSNGADPARCMALVEGSQPDLSCEIRDLATDRLRTASLLQCGALAAFLLLRIPVLDQYVTVADWMLLGAHVLLMIVSGLIGLRLVCGCTHTRQHYRIAELAVFGGAAVFLVLMNYNALIRSAEFGHLTPVVVPWLLLIFTYALYIPNSWKRAAAVIIPMALCPIIVLVIAQIMSPDVSRILAAHNRFEGGLLEAFLVMSVAAVAAIWGAGRMNLLSSEAYQAHQLGQYRLKERLGSGGMGDVYLAEHVLLKRPCAVKVIRPEKADDPQLLARFEREVQAASQLTHWNSIEIFDYGRADDGTFYYVMEYLPGMNLDQMVKQFGPLPPERVVHFLEQTCDALSEAHDLGLIHRDIKPANLFAAQRGGLHDVTKLLDFGLVRSAQRPDDPQLTQTGSVTGSPQFLSPEQAVGDDVDARTDIYSLGAVGWFLLTGRALFDGENPIKVILAHAHQEPELPSRYVPDVPRDLEAVIMRCLAKKVSERYPTVREMRDDLLRCQSAGQWTRERAAEWWDANDLNDSNGRMDEVEPALTATLV